MDNNEQAHEDALETGDSQDNDQPSSNFDLLQEVNETRGAGMEIAGAEKPVQTKTETPKPATETTKPAVEPANADKTTKVITETLSPEDPEFVRNRTTDKTTDEEKPSGDQGTETDKGTKTDQAVIPQDFTRLSELTDGAIKSEEDFTGLIERYNDLAAQAEEGFKPKFTSEAHKRAFELLANVPQGQELETARRVHHALSLDTSGLKGKDLLFEGFLLDPENSDIKSREEAREIFERQYEKMYGDAESDVLVKRELTKAEKRAKEMIEKTQGEFVKPVTDEATKETEVDPTVMTNVKKAVSEFGGLALSFSENPAENEILKIKADPDELQALERYMHNPQEFWKELTSQHVDEKGNFDYKGFTNTMYEFANIQKIKRLTLEHGIELGKLQAFNKDRNSSSTADDTKQKGRVGAGPKKEAGSFVEAWEGAVNR